MAHPILQTVRPEARDFVSHLFVRKHEEARGANLSERVQPARQTCLEPPVRRVEFGKEHSIRHGSMSYRHRRGSLKIFAERERTPLRQFFQMQGNLLRLLFDHEFVMSRLDELIKGFIGMRPAIPNRKGCGGKTCRPFAGESGRG